jgi:hypothetical protein
MKILILNLNTILLSYKIYDEIKRAENTRNEINTKSISQETIDRKWIF